MINSTGRVDRMAGPVLDPTDRGTAGLRLSARSSVAYLVGVLAVSVAVAFGLGAAGGLAQTQAPSPNTTSAANASSTAGGVGAAGQPCSTLQLVGKGFDLGTPFLQAARSGTGSCEVTATAAGDALTIIRWILQLAAWALAALFIAGFTGIVRRT